MRDNSVRRILVEVFGATGYVISNNWLAFMVVIWITMRVREFSNGILTVIKNFASNSINKLCGRPPQYASAPCKLTFDLLTLKVVSESRVT